MTTLNRSFFQDWWKTGITEESKSHQYSEWVDGMMKNIGKFKKAKKVLRRGEQYRCFLGCALEYTSAFEDPDRDCLKASYILLGLRNPYGNIHPRFVLVYKRTPVSSVSDLNDNTNCSIQEAGRILKKYEWLFRVNLPIPKEYKDQFKEAKKYDTQVEIHI